MKPLFNYHRQRLEQTVIGTIERIVPDRLLNTLVIRRIALVTSSDPRLGNVIVPRITIDQIIRSIQRNEGRG